MIPSVRTGDVQRAVDFYTGKLGFDILRSSEGNVAVGFGSDRVMLEAAGEFYSPEYSGRMGSASPHAIYLEVTDSVRRRPLPLLP
jgi:catechol 2,3-dioxygenase-like lactoylglutathione lyase family enzyme